MPLLRVLGFPGSPNIARCLLVRDRVQQCSSHLSHLCTQSPTSPHLCTQLERAVDWADLPGLPFLDKPARLSICRCISWLWQIPLVSVFADVFLDFDKYCLSQYLQMYFSTLTNTARLSICRCISRLWQILKQIKNNLIWLTISSKLVVTIITIFRSLLLSLSFLLSLYFHHLQGISNSNSDRVMAPQIIYDIYDIYHIWSWFVTERQRWIEPTVCEWGSPAEGIGTEAH